MTNQKPTCGFAWRGYIRESVLPKKKKIEKNSQKQIIRGMIDWGTKKIPRASNNPPPPRKKNSYKKVTPKNPMPNCWDLKISRMFVFVYSSYHPHLVVVLTTLETPGAQEHFEYPKKSLLKSSHPKNTCQIFLPKKNQNRKFQTPKKSFAHPCHLKSRVPSWGIALPHLLSQKGGTVR